MLVRIYDTNVFPDLRVSWGTYPNNLGHDAFPGCFRCHDDEHKTADGKTITQDCGACHEAVAIEESSPEVLKTLGSTRGSWPSGRSGGDRGSLFLSRRDCDAV